MLDKEREVSWTRTDQLGGMLPVMADSELADKLCRLVRPAQLAGRLPVTVR